MAHIEVFQCPSCGANLSYDGGPETSFPCQFCGTTVVVPEEMRPRTAPQAAGYAGQGQWAAGALPLDKLAEIKRLTQSGRKIEAIKVYREITGVGLREAKDAVEQLEAGLPLTFTSSTSANLSGGSLSADQAAQMINAALDVARQQQAGQGGGGYGGAGASATMAQPGQARAGRGANRLWCTLVGCMSALIFAGVTLGLLVSAGVPLGLTSIVRQAVKTLETPPSAEATAMPRAIATATVSVVDADATAGAKARSTQQAKTRAANATATQAAQDTATAAAAEATAQAEAEATARAVIAAQAAWPVVVGDNFSSNQLGWPVGPSDDDYFNITTTVKSKKFAWVFVPKRSAYANAYPLNPKSYGDFSATVKLKFVQGGEDTNSTAGLVFRHADPDYGFFGIDGIGHYVVNLVFPNSGLQIYQQAHSAAIQTGTGQVNQLTVRGLGPDLVFLVNDQVVWQNSHDLPEGDMGLGVDSQDKGERVSLEFTEYAVRAPKK